MAGGFAVKFAIKGVEDAVLDNMEGSDMLDYHKKWNGCAIIVCRGLLAAVLLTMMGCSYSASKTVLVLGDSLSAEYGLARNTGWVALLQKRCIEKNIDAKVVNASISGDTTSGGRARLPALLNKYHPDIVIIELGGNDGLRGLPLKASQANFQVMIEATQKTKAKVLLVGMQLPPNYGRDYSGQFFRMFGILAKQNKVALVPFLLEGIAEKLEWFQQDRIHPIAAAHPHILDNVWPHLLPLFVKKDA
jgi:acyl-CoA thioesterase-1